GAPDVNATHARGFVRQPQVGGFFYGEVAMQTAKLLLCASSCATDHAACLHDRTRTGSQLVRVLRRFLFYFSDFLPEFGFDLLFAFLGSSDLFDSFIDTLFGPLGAFPDTFFSPFDPFFDAFVGLIGDVSRVVATTARPDSGARDDRKHDKSQAQCAQLGGPWL
ncbi:MAG: hypothetical protein WD827_02660, partial [Solirubrobacterales bacterium]